LTITIKIQQNNKTLLQYRQKHRKKKEKIVQKQIYALGIKISYLNGVLNFGVELCVIQKIKK